MATQPLNWSTLEDYLKVEDALGYRSEFHDGLPPARFLAPALTSTSHRRARFFTRMPLSFADKRTTRNRTASTTPRSRPELLSPNTKDYDYGTKREYYFTLTSLRHYLLISQSEPMVGHYARSGDAWYYVDRGADATISLGDAEIQVNEIYAGILPKSD